MNKKQIVSVNGELYNRVLSNIQGEKIIDFYRTLNVILCYCLLLLIKSMNNIIIYGENLCFDSPPNKTCAMHALFKI